MSQPHTSNAKERVEYNDLLHQNLKCTLLSGFYREWSHEGLENSEAQVQGLENFTSQIERASSENKHQIIFGDANP